MSVHVSRPFHRAPLACAAIASLASLTYSATAVVRFVDASSPGPVHNGTSWVQAYTSLQTALAAAVNGDEIWVANGTYKPTGTNDRTISFDLPVEVRLFGGFAGAGTNEVSIAQRDILANPTILSGDIGLPFIAADNSLHVVTAGATVTAATALDGFYITRGNANGGGLDNFGGGMRNDGEPHIRNCLFVGNQGGLGSAFCSVGNNDDNFLINCVFNGNSGGSALEIQNARAVIVNCTFSGNTVGSVAALRFLNAGGTSVVRNTIAYGNVGTAVLVQNRQITVTNSDVDVDRCCIEGLTGSLGGVGNLSGDPRFRDGDGADDVLGTPDDDLSLLGGSAVIDAGDNGFLFTDTGDMDDDNNFAEPIPFDLAYEDRRSDDILANIGAGALPIVDLGAFEFRQKARVICVNDNATGAGNGTNWIDAYTSLQSALVDATDPKAPGPEVIFVAQGTYTPSTPAARTATFSLVSGTGIYGGFDDSGTQSSIAERRPDECPTILSGDIGIAGDNSDNCFHVVTANGANFFGLISPVLDGFVITGGNANGSGADSDGGGLRAFNSTAFDPVIRNCKFVSNAATGGGSAVRSQTTDIALINCVFSANNSPTSTPVISLVNPSNPSVIGCTIAHNNTLGLSLASVTGATIVNSVVVSNGGTNAQSGQVFVSGGAPSLDYCCIEGLTGSLGGVGNIATLPAFADPDGADDTFGTPDDDYRLLGCSSGIDAGDFNALPTDFDDLDDDLQNVFERLPIDRAGDERLRNDSGIDDSGNGPTHPDMGAYEFQGTSGDSCPADCSPAPNGNGEVDVDDLVTVILDWGIGPAAGDVSPACPDGVIDVDDLVAVILAWGTCP